MATFGNYIFDWLVGYSGLLGPETGITAADYFLIRPTRLKPPHPPPPPRRLRIHAKASTPQPSSPSSLGILAALIGRIVPTLAFLYNYAWFLGFFLSGTLYTLLMLRHRPNPHRRHPERSEESLSQLHTAVILSAAKDLRIPPAATTRLWAALTPCSRSASTPHSTHPTQNSVISTGARSAQ